MCFVFMTSTKIGNTWLVLRWIQIQIQIHLSTWCWNTCPVGSSLTTSWRRVASRPRWFVMTVMITMLTNWLHRWQWQNTGSEEVLPSDHFCPRFLPQVFKSSSETLRPHVFKSTLRPVFTRIMKSDRPSLWNRNQPQT